MLELMEPGIAAFEKAFLTPYREAVRATVQESGTKTVKALKKLRIKGAAKSVPKPDQDFAFDVTNQHVLDWIEEHTLEGVDDISKATRDAVRDIIARAFREQTDLKDYAEELTEAIGDATRADLIARTESMIAANEGQAEAWDQAVEAGLLTGNEQKTWIVSEDEALCPICDGLADQTVGLDENFKSPDTGEEFDQPPAHPRCRCTTGLVG